MQACLNCTGGIQALQTCVLFFMKLHAAWNDDMFPSSTLSNISFCLVTSNTNRPSKEDT